tara:strand:+ start:175 stop:1296 length:1122 start_codon:yes stop_codon:yes gene_type:complete
MAENEKMDSLSRMFNTLIRTPLSEVESVIRKGNLESQPVAPVEELTDTYTKMAAENEPMTFTENIDKPQVNQEFLADAPSFMELIPKEERLDESKFQQKVVLDTDGVYRLKTFPIEENVKTNVDILKEQIGVEQGLLEKPVEDFGGINLGIQGAKQRELDDTIADKVLTESEIKDIKQAEKIIQDRENTLEKEKKSNNIITYDSGLMYNKDTNTYSSTDPKMNALISVESSGKHTKKGKINVPGGDVEDLTKARGLTQLKPTSFSDLEGKKKYARNFDRSFTVSEIDNPETNYLIGEEYLNNLFKDFKRLGYGEDDAQDLGYIAYNQGYQAVLDWLAGKKSLKKEGQEYIRKINKELGIDRGVKDRKEYKKIK